MIHDKENGVTFSYTSDLHSQIEKLSKINSLLASLLKETTRYLDHGNYAENQSQYDLTRRIKQALSLAKGEK